VPKADTPLDAKELKQRYKRKAAPPTALPQWLKLRTRTALSRALFPQRRFREIHTKKVLVGTSHNVPPQRGAFAQHEACIRQDKTRQRVSKTHLFRNCRASVFGVSYAAPLGPL
jgi:hypothetical protein